MQRRVRSQHVSNGKRVAVGNTAGRVPPAWRAATTTTMASSVTQLNGHGNGGYNDQTRRKEQYQHHQFQSVGSKIILSQLPTDTVSEGEVEHLFTSTIGPVFDCYLAHNSQGRSKGVAIVHFQRIGDALEARRKYNGKIIDGRRPLKIELIVDPPPGALPVIKKVEKTLSLADRLSGPANPSSNNARTSGSSPDSPQSQPQSQPPLPPPPRPTNPRRLTARVKARAYRQTIKRGPRRTNKSATELDQEMDSYMAARKPIISNATGS